MNDESKIIIPEQRVYETAEKQQSQRRVYKIPPEYNCSVDITVVWG